MGYADRYDPDTDFDHWYTDATGRAIAEWVRPGDAVLELGCATGRMSEALVGAGATLVGVDRARTYLDRAEARGLEGATFVEGDIVAVDLSRRFDHVVVANVVHEVPDPGALYATATHHLAPGGALHVTLQNPRSIHRLVGQDLGLIASLDEVSDRGRQFETIEVLDADRLTALGAAVGLDVVHRAGVMLKPLPNDLMATLPDTILEGFIAVARHFPDHSAMNYLQFRRPGAGSTADGAR
jgi:2-polyprenyl-3-methyl-5-hydroxy-6-metoxy-1,4-benzoquinol methylase